MYKYSYLAEWVGNIKYQYISETEINYGACGGVSVVALKDVTGESEIGDK